MKKNNEQDVRNLVSKCMNKLKEPEVVNAVLLKINSNENEPMTIDNFCQHIMRIVIAEEKNKHI